MCGILGLFGDDNNFQTNAKREYILQGLYIDALRGMDSSGIALLNKKGKPEVYKRALPGGDFVCTKAVLRLTGRLPESYGVIGHNRSMTKGQVTDENAHPFQYKHITLVHNGTVYNSDKLTTIKCGADSDVDSAQVAWSFSEVEPDELLPIMNGPFSLVWWDSRDGSLHFARNDQKPMYWALAYDKRTMYFASELEMVQLLTKRNNILTSNEYMFTAPGKHYIFKKPWKLDDYETRPFAEPNKNKNKGNKGPFQQGGKQSTAVTQVSSTTPSENSPKSNMTTSPTGITGPTTNKKEFGTSTSGIARNHPAANEGLTKTMVQTINNGITLAHRISETKVRCAKDGVEFKKVIVAQPKVWKVHIDNQQIGTMLLEYYSKITQKILVLQVLNCSLGNWMDKTRIGRVPVKITGYRESFSPDQNLYVAEIDESVFDVMVKRANDKKENSLDTVEIGMMRVQYVSVNEFHDLLRNGCTNCGSHKHMDIDHANNIAWVGPDERNPICPDCAVNPQIMTALLQEYADGSNTSTTTKH